MPISLQQKPLLGKLRIQSTIVVETGLHIGGGGENLDIGGLDHPVIRDPLTKYPCIPGSSLKGKLRSILERFYNKPLNREGNKVYIYASDDLEDGYTEIKGQLIRYDGAKRCKVSRIFGSTGGSNCWIKNDVVEREDLDKIANVKPRKIHTKEHRFVGEEEGDIGELHTKVKGRNFPARLIVRDCHLDGASAEKLKKVDTGLYMTEWKFENSIDRITAAANPRQLERVPAGSKFNFEMIYTVEDEKQAVEDLKNLFVALTILEDDALGGHGSRGYGKIKFSDTFEFTYNDYEKYRNQLKNDVANLEDFTKNFQVEVENAFQLLKNFPNIQQSLFPLLLPPQNKNNE